jgi:hypothetical protein
MNAIEIPHSEIDFLRCPYIELADNHKEIVSKTLRILRGE